MEKPKKKMNRGAVLLERHRAGRPYGELAKELGFSLSAAWRLCHAETLPSRQRAITLFRVAKVPLTAWDDAA